MPFNLATTDDLAAVTSQLNALTSRVAALEGGKPAPTPTPAAGGPAPVCGLPGYVVDREWTFGAAGKIKAVADLKAEWNSSLSWGVINKEFQRYTDFAPANIAIVGDTLQLIATPTRGIGEGQIDSAEIASKFTWPVNGIVEFCVKEAKGTGMWGAGWLYDLNPATTNSSEIDVFEIVRNQEDNKRDTTRGVFVNDHSNGQQVATAAGSQLDQWGKFIAPFDFADDFHTFAVVCNGDQKTRYIDAVKVVDRLWHWTAGPPNIILNLACGANPAATDFAGQPNAASFQNGANVLACRYIRTWKKA